MIEQFTRSGQGHVFAFLDRLAPAERASLLAEAAEIDLAEIDRLYRTLGAGSGSGAPGSIEPVEYEPLPENGGSADDWAKAKSAGEEALRAGRVAAFTVAGGQGTRLGFDGPKGTFPVTPVRQATLFQVFAEKIRTAGRRYGRPLHWFIMTSPQNHAATESFFGANRHFGLDPGRVHFFPQGRVPAVDFSGKILLEAPGRIALSPDGHGGSLRALARSGALDTMRSEKIDTISYFQVDNPLVRCIDPAFIGWHLSKSSGMTSKMVPKIDPAEKVGVFCKRDGRICIVEYSDLPTERQQERDPGGRLRFLAGNIAVHVLDREFVRRMGQPGSSLPFHRAEKKIPTIDAAGAAVTPKTPNGIKFEMFVFDALPFARNPLVIETRRADDFSPVKNGDGVDSPRTCRDDQLRQYARWLESVGVKTPADSNGVPTFALEVSPLFGCDEDSFRESWSRLNPPPRIEANLVLE